MSQDGSYFSVTEMEELFCSLLIRKQESKFGGRGFFENGYRISMLSKFGGDNIPGGEELVCDGC